MRRRRRRGSTVRPRGIILHPGVEHKGCRKTKTGSCDSSVLGTGARERPAGASGFIVDGRSTFQVARTSLSSGRATASPVVLTKGVHRFEPSGFAPFRFMNPIHD